MLQKIILFVLMMSPFAQAGEPSLYHEKIQPLFNQRCVACHSCFNAPCQLNLQNYEGFSRGANKLNVYDGSRLKSVEPSRIWVDAHSPSEWRKKSFFSVNTSEQSQDNVFFQMLLLRFTHPDLKVQKQVYQSQVCASSMREYKSLERHSPELGMPYGLPPLTKDEMETLTGWIEKGTPGPTTDEVKEAKAIPASVQEQANTWQNFLNGDSDKQKLVSRYLYEHLFLAHIYFPEDKKLFFRLIRSRTACSVDLDEIAARRPNDDPGVKKFFYCLQKYPGTVVMKIHMPYEWSPSKLARYKKLFMEPEWQTHALPSYESDIAANPFLAFQDIPAKSRYQFLLDDAQYEISTFIKGPVCNGSMAVNSIQEQFYVFFLKPEADNMVLSKDYEAKVGRLLMLPGVWGSDVHVIETPIFMTKLIERRENYRRFRTQEFIKLRPKGYSLEDIWDGDGHNDNAVLTVFRHDQNAVVAKGAAGDLSKTIFVLDYPLMERLVYDLVVNFDVFGNVSHQLLTRVYMDLIRMEAEELFLQFLPPSQRLAYRQSWYKGPLTEAKLKYVFPDVSSQEPTSVTYNMKKNTKQQFVEKILFSRMTAEARGPLDFMNWKHVQVPMALKRGSLGSVESALQNLTAVPAIKTTPFSRYFPDIAYLMISPEHGKSRIFSIIHNKEHENVSWILAESQRMAPEEDTLTIREGYWGSYPNLIFKVSEKSFKGFVAEVRKVQSDQDFASLTDHFGIRRQNPQFWNFYDELIDRSRETQGVDFGYLDLTRYDL